MNQLDFVDTFEKLTGNPPFPWQSALYAHFLKGYFPPLCSLPTGLGKTSIIAIWLVALANVPHKAPRRLVYVVNRRTVVDQTTEEVERFRNKLIGQFGPPPEVLYRLAEGLMKLSAEPTTDPLAISTLRGQFADNREWSSDPSRPAVICGTVDMIGSRLLFSGYGVGFKGKPLHAGFLGQDVLLVHDEAQLEPAFQELIVKIENEQKRCPNECGKFRVMEVSATSRGERKVFTLTDEEKNPETATEPAPASLRMVWKRITAKKGLKFHGTDRISLAKEIGKIALRHKQSGKAILVFVRTIEEVKTVHAILTDKKGGVGVLADQVQVLTGTLRGLERDRLAKDDPIFQRLLLKVPPDNRAVYLICTSAGEVGIDISADHMVCDLTPYESMAQRLGRVNRRGDGAAEIDVVSEFDRDPKKQDDGLEKARWLTKDILERLSNCTWIDERHEASPHKLSRLIDQLTEQERKAVFSPTPEILPVSDILFDAWALTTIRGKMPGRPPVEAYLHGVEDEKQRETHVAWREEVSRFADTAVSEEQIAELLDQFPLRPHELLRDATYRVQDELADLAAGQEGQVAWVIDPDDAVHVVTLGKLAEKDKKGYAVNLAGRTVVLPPSAGGLTNTGTLSGSARHDPERKYDVAGQVALPGGSPLVRLLVTSGEEKTTYSLFASILDPPKTMPFQLDDKPERLRIREVFADPPMRVAFRLDLPAVGEDDESSKYLVLKPESRQRVARHEAEWPSLDVHNARVGDIARELCARLNLSTDISRAVILAAKWHDLGKGRSVWQRGAGNKPTAEPVSKPIHGRPPENLSHFRHELGSVIDVGGDPVLAAELKNLFNYQTEWARELTLHLIAAHHGRARPHFPEAEAADPERPAIASASVAADTPGRFARLQRQFGRWGLAYLESLVRAADALDSKRIEETPLGDEEPGQWPVVAEGFAWPAKRPTPEPTIRVAVAPTNPGQFFACCGLLELADRLWPGAEGWFSEIQFHIACEGTLEQLIAAVVRAELDLVDPSDIYSSAASFQFARRGLVIDWWLDQGYDQLDRMRGSRVKPWAGTMQSVGIARAMKAALARAEAQTEELLNYACIVPDADNPKKKKEPYHFDSRRGANSLPVDIGFVQDAIGIPTTAHPAVEFFCFIGLQRSRPTPADRPRTFTYHTWAKRYGALLLPAAVNGLLGDSEARCYRFENAFRTGQKKHKAFNPAVPITPGDHT